jgi:hypothetical protein
LASDPGRLGAKTGAPGQDSQHYPPGGSPLPTTRYFKLALKAFTERL